MHVCLLDLKSNVASKFYIFFTSQYLDIIDLYLDAIYIYVDVIMYKQITSEYLHHDAVSEYKNKCGLKHDSSGYLSYLFSFVLFFDISCFSVLCL